METGSVLKAMTEARVHHLAGRLGQAEVLYRRVLEMDPGAHRALHGLGVLALQVNRPELAAEFYRQALQMDPTQLEYWVNGGEALRQTGRLEEAIGVLKRARELAPGSADAAYNLGRALMDHREYGAAREAFSRATELAPADHEAMNNLGVVLQNLGMAEAALEWFGRAMKINGDPIPRGNYIQMMNYLPFSRAEISAAHRAWGAELEARCPRMRIPARRRHERIKVGYVSSCFRNHAAARFLVSALKGHDHSRFEIFGYSRGNIRDEMTQRAMGLVDQWREIFNWSDEQAAGRILADEIDILVDIDGHTSDNRIAMLARKPAPIVVSWLGYQNTTGLTTVDYRLTDGWVDLEGLTDGDYTEKLVRIPGAFYCYDAPGMDLSTDRTGDGRFTFGSFNSLMKISRGVLETWAEILSRTGDSKLRVVLTGEATDPEYGHLRAPFEARGIADRVEWVGRLGYADYLKAFARVDVSLDPFPCVGHTTTCDAIWMGSAALTLAGEDYRSRLGVSVLSNLGLEHWIAKDREEYVQKAVELAQEGEKLRAGRAMLRRRLVESSLCDAKGFTKKLEAVYQRLLSTMLA